MKKVFVGLSGGVDSSVAALLLKQQGYDVVGVYMKNWSQDLLGMKCPWQEDYRDAKRVAVQLGIDFKMYDFQKQYRQKVVDYMVREYKAGRTPNPDIMCNQEVKFKLFLETALEDGAEYIATGHYARISQAKSVQALSSKLSAQSSHLLRAKDENKDQTYFLYRVSPEALKKVIFPLGNLTKPEVRELAKKHNLISANRKESMGICFVGNVGIKDFLIHEALQEALQGQTLSRGEIIDQHGDTIGEHEGAIFYTIGQRHGLSIGGGLPYYVTSKDMKKNEVYVTTDLQDEKLWSRHIKLANTHWLGESKGEISVRMRHRSPLVPVKSLNKPSNLTASVELEEEVRALTPGQSAVFYSDNKVLGGGIVV